MSVLPGLRVENLSFHFSDSRKVLEKVTFAMRQGEMVAMLGANGSGKTTLLGCLTGFLQKKGGVVAWDGVPLETFSPTDLAKKIAWVDSSENDFVPFRLEEFLLLGRSPHTGFWGSFSENDVAKTREMMEKFRLTDLKDQFWGDLSLGEKQRARIAMAFARESPFILMDEPTSHLDPYFQREVLSHLKKQCREKNCGALAILHDLNLARFFDRVLLLHNGEIFRDDIPEKVIERDSLAMVYGKGVFDLQVINGTPIGFLKGI